MTLCDVTFQNIWGDFFHDYKENASDFGPEDLKNAFILAALEDRPQAETAELGISLKAVEMRVYRARKLLLEKMSKMGF